MDDFTKFIKNHVIFAKTSNTVIVKRYKNDIYFFFDDIYLSKKLFILLIMKKLNFDNFHIEKSQWNELHQECNSLLNILDIKTNKIPSAFYILDKITDYFSKLYKDENLYSSAHPNFSMNQWIIKVCEKLKEVEQNLED